MITYPFYLANNAESPNSDLEVTDKYTSEIAYRVQRACLDYLDAPIECVSADDVPMPYAKNLEQEVLPQPHDVVAAVKHVLYLE